MGKREIDTVENKEDHLHPIIFLEWIDVVTFNGCIISLWSVNGNIPMLKKYFQTHDENGNSYDIQFENSHLIPNITFRKMKFRVNCNKVKGRLTKSGIDFIEQYSGGEPILCTTSIKKYKNRLI